MCGTKLIEIHRVTKLADGLDFILNKLVFKINVCGLNRVGGGQPITRGTAEIDCPPQYIF